jgi:Methyltransferase domain
MIATAVEAWDERWTTPEGRADWLVPHPALAALVPLLKARGTQHVLDLGCGVGRHALLFAEHGFAVEAIDGAAAGLDFASREAATRGLRLSLRRADADGLPFADETFDYVLSWNLFFHGTLAMSAAASPRFGVCSNPADCTKAHCCQSATRSSAVAGRWPPIPSSAAATPRRTRTTIATWPALPRSSPASSFSRCPRRSNAAVAPGTGTSSPNGGEWGLPCQCVAGPGRYDGSGFRPGVGPIARSPRSERP